MKDMPFNINFPLKHVLYWILVKPDHQLIEEDRKFKTFNKNKNSY